jgi:hypothetical protein
VKLEDAKKYAMSLPGTTEEPHFDMRSWRVNHKIFATVPVERGRLHIFVDESETRACVEEDPAAFEELWWGKKLVGVRVNLSKAKTSQVGELLEDAWSRRAPKRLHKFLKGRLDS